MSSFDHPEVHQVTVDKRGCGWPRAGMYLIGDGLWAECGRLPIPLDFCPCCGQKLGASLVSSYQSLNLSRGWTWIDGAVLRASAPECANAKRVCSRCTINRLERAGMLSVGSAYYKMPIDFIREAAVQGISKRISQLPKDFQVGVTPIALAHRHVIHHEVKLAGSSKVTVHWTPGIFAIFTPREIRYVLDGSESTKFVDSLLNRGITPVQIIRNEPIQTQLVTP